MYVVCNEHLDNAIDDFVDVYEQPPDLYELGSVTFTEWDVPKTCDFCDHFPRYLVV
ncbi:CxxH/CxxC protein, BA_5709 family [Natronincola peptidivorans]|uniref:CxxH/CxxC protein, BA_5709 family n=1 Tax=Natronincola peptidivorans TaxID=426128 RepID=A0A1I0B4G0_9FIRM|nr:CxxH/CxxC protein [Natronincola peptidivorans]SET01259.1 CxxH/CxxC protein, BA_5709 family [Natronincola peptidivorans]